MIEKLPTYCAVVDSTSESFWSNVEGGEKYDKDLAEKAMKDPDKCAEKLGGMTALRRHVMCGNGGDPMFPSSIMFSLQHVMLPLCQSLAHL